MSTPNGTTVPLALITGASRGLGRALATQLAERGWDLLIDGRDAAALTAARDALAATAASVEAVVGDVADPFHRRELLAALAHHDHLDLLVNNASTLPSSPQPGLAELCTPDLERTFAVNVVAPHALTRGALSWLLAAQGTVIDVSSDAAVEHHPGWGAYGASKAALDHLTGTWAQEHPTVRAYAVDPGDLRTELHQQAFPGEDISDRPEPATVVPALLGLLDQRPASGRYRLADLAASRGPLVVGGAR